MVVAGDIKRGKISLINALVDRPGLLPVDADVATAVHLVLSHGEADHATATTVDGERFAISFDQIREHASMQGDPDTVGRVATVEVQLDHPLLARGVQIVDTPGVGGMTHGHREITMAALRRADLLIFVVSANEPVSRTELEFLADASERIGHVVLVASRADLSTSDTVRATVADLAERIRSCREEVADDDATESAATRARRLDRMAAQPVIATSAHLAEGARIRQERGRLEMAATLRRQSGLDELIDHIDRSVQARDLLRLANLLQLMSTLMAALEDEQNSRARALDGDSSIQTELADRQAQLEAAASQQARWRSTLATSMSRLQTRAGRDVGRELGLVRDHYRHALDEQSDIAGLERLGVELQQSLHAAWANLAETVSASFGSVISELLEDLGIDDEPDLFGDLDMPESLVSGNRVRPAGAGVDQVDLLQDVLPMATQTFMFGNIANVMVGVLGVATGGLGVLAYGVGAALSVPVVTMRRKQRARQMAAQELQREIGEALFGQEGIAREFTTELTLRILDAREQLETLIETRLTQRRTELEQRRRELQELLKGEQSERSAARRDHERQTEESRALRDNTGRLSDRVAADLARTLTIDPAHPPPDIT